MTTDVPGWMWPPARRLRTIASEVAADWGLMVGEPFERARYSFVAPAGEHVIKIVPPEDTQSDHEADALEVWNGMGAVRLLRHDRARRAMLIERARPGTDASSLPDEDAIRIAVQVGRLLWREPGAQFASAYDNTRAGLDRSGAPSTATSALRELSWPS